MKKMARSLVQRIELATDRGRRGPCYLSQDRCELQFAVKELPRRMQQPNTTNMQALKLSGAILEGKSEMFGRVQQTSWTANRGRLLRQRLGMVFEDQRSTSSSHVMLGRHLLASSTQNVVATSSGEGGSFTH